MEIQALSLSELKEVSGIESINITNQVAKSSFEELLVNSATALNDSINASDAAIKDLALGKAQSTHEVIMAIESAKMSLQLAVEVRNKLVDAYQEILRMPI